MRRTGPRPSRWPGTGLSGSGRPRGGGLPCYQERRATGVTVIPDEVQLLSKPVVRVQRSWLRSFVTEEAGERGALRKHGYDETEPAVPAEAPGDATHRVPLALPGARAVPELLCATAGVTLCAQCLLGTPSLLSLHGRGLLGICLPSSQRGAAHRRCSVTVSGTNGCTR